LTCPLASGGEVVTPLYLPAYAFYGERRDYDFSGVPLALVPGAAPAGTDVCDTTTWGNISGRVVVLAASFIYECGDLTSSLGNAEKILANISAQRASSVTIWPYPATGIFTMRRFTLGTSRDIGHLRTVHANLGSDDSSAFGAAYTSCVQLLLSGQAAPPAVRLLPEADTHIELYESSGIAIACVLFALSCIVLAFVCHVLRKSCLVLRRLGATHAGLCVSIVQLVSRGVVLTGPLGYVCIAVHYAMPL
jgi:hypothetical protein